MPANPHAYAPHRSVFRSQAKYYDLHIRDGAALHASPATMRDWGGQEEPAVAVFTSGARVQFVVPLQDARRLADQLHDVIDAAETAAEGA